MTSLSAIRPILAISRLAWATRSSSEVVHRPSPSKQKYSRPRHVETIRQELEARYPNLHLVGRNGMHKYNNQDHAMMTAMLTAKNILAGARVYDVWNVNEDAEYHEAGGSGVKEALASERLVPQKAKQAETAAA